MIKLCYIIGQLGKGGAEKQLYELLKGLNREYFDPVVVSLSLGGHWSGEIEKINVPVIEIPRKKSKEFARLYRLVRLLSTMKPDIVHTYMFSANTYGRIAGMLAGVPVIIASERNAARLGKDKDRVQICIDKLLASFSDAIICNSFRAAASLLKKYSFSTNKVFAIHNGINTSDYPINWSWVSSRMRSVQKSGVIGTIGRLYPQKNQKLFLDMAKIILRKYPDRKLQFMIIGKGPLQDDLIKYSKTLGIYNNIVFTGERTDIPELLHAMDIFVMTSEYEGLSNAIMEAMLAGLPVVATDVGGNRELIVDGETGFLCPDKDAAALADKVISLMDNDDNIRQTGKNGRCTICSEFGVEKMVNATENVYISLMAQKQVRGRSDFKISGIQRQSSLK